ncbi:MAG: FecR family protein, partial [Oscillospiraceae bacterium]|nr:FecR family protein [Oscillospiraceae bacterium]
MKQNTKRALSLLTALSLLLSLLAGCSSKVEAATMRLKRTEGTVGVSNGAGKDLEPAENLGLYSGYGVDTKAASYAWIDLDEVKLTKMDENSQVEIKKEDKHLTIEVKSGSLFFNITEPLAEDEMLDIRTSTMLVGIRGTCGWVEVLDEEHMNIYLLEGKVECTAGENTATANAGEMAEMSADGMIEVSAFSGSAVPAFVREEVEDDENLMEAILDDSGIDVTGGGASADELADYADILDEITAHGEEILYTEILDFEADGKPELLAIVNTKTDGLPNSDYITIYICQKEMRLMGFSASSYNVNGIGITSLVEKGGRLFVRIQRTQTFPASPGEFSTDTSYAGSVAKEDGSREDWGWVDHFERSEHEYGVYYSRFL